MNAKTLQKLEGFDTPTICNALELLDPTRKGFGYTTENLMCINGSYGPVAGYAVTATMRSYRPSDLSNDEIKAYRLEYYKYVYDMPGPKICIMQDLDGARAGWGPFWGEFNTRIHQTIGCKGIVTDGSIRDVGNLPDDVLILGIGLRPSHGYVHIVDFDIPVSISGMYVLPASIVHADEHGAVCFSSDQAQEVLKLAAKVVAQEHPIIEECKKGGMNFDRLAELYMKRS